VNASWPAVERSSRTEGYFAAKLKIRSELAMLAGGVARGTCYVQSLKAPRLWIFVRLAMSNKRTSALRVFMFCSSNNNEGLRPRKRAVEFRPTPAPRISCFSLLFSLKQGERSRVRT